MVYQAKSDTKGNRVVSQLPCLGLFMSPRQSEHQQLSCLAVELVIILVFRLSDFFLCTSDTGFLEDLIYYTDLGRAFARFTLLCGITANVNT